MRVGTPATKNQKMPPPSARQHPPLPPVEENGGAKGDRVADEDGERGTVHLEQPVLRDDVTGGTDQRRSERQGNGPRRPGALQTSRGPRPPARARYDRRG